MLPRRLELMRNKAELKSEMSTIVAMFRINCMRRINALKQKHRRELLNLARLKRQTESELIQKGSFRRDTLFQRSHGGSRRQEHSSNGHAKQASTRTKLLADGMETIVQLDKTNFFRSQTLLTVWFSNVCRKTNTKVISPTNHNNAINQSELRAPPWNLFKAQEKSRVQGVIGFNFTSHEKIGARVLNQSLSVAIAIV